jgi:hypothetical protein
MNVFFVMCIIVYCLAVWHLMRLMFSSFLMDKIINKAEIILKNRITQTIKTKQCLALCLSIVSPSSTWCCAFNFLNLFISSVGIGTMHCTMRMRSMEPPHTLVDYPTSSQKKGKEK